MLKQVLIMSICCVGFTTAVFADDTPPQQYNDPTVNSLAASSQQFPSENKLTGEKGKTYNSPDAPEVNKPNVNSFAASSQQYPQQNELTGKKKQKYYTKDEMKKKKNKPNVNSRMASSEQFPEQDSFNNDGKGYSHNKSNSSGAK